MARSWSRLEVEATVADYFDMFDSWLRGDSYNKAAHGRALAGHLQDRTLAAIEWKRRNISAILIELGVPPIPGYKPAVNYQQMLFEIVEDRLRGDDQRESLLRAHVDTERLSTPTVEDFLERLVAPPSAPSSKIQHHAYERPRRSQVRRIDYLAREARNASLGRAGEEFVANFERARLIHEGRDHLADQVENVAVSFGDGLGYDVLSFEASGAERLIEVKTTTFGIFTPFYVTANEIGVSRDRSEAYHLYRPFGFGTDPKLFQLPGAIETTCVLFPTVYQAQTR